jgi:hypothetical protein
VKLVLALWKPDATALFDEGADRDLDVVPTSRYCFDLTC